MIKKKAKMQFMRISVIFLLMSGFLYGVVTGGGLAWYCQPHGAVNYRGEPAPDGMEVVAFIQNTPFATCRTEGGNYWLWIPKDDPETKEKEGWAKGDMITVWVDGYAAVPSFEAFEGDRVINLYLPTLDVKLTTWGKIKALFR